MMENKRLVIGFIWTFIIAVLIIESMGAGFSFVGYMTLFFVAFGASLVVEFMIPDKKRGFEQVKVVQDRDAC